jgi:hypothetical protein
MEKSLLVLGSRKQQDLCEREINVFLLFYVLLDFL